MRIMPCAILHTRAKWVYMKSTMSDVSILLHSLRAWYCIPYSGKAPTDFNEALQKKALKDAAFAH